MKKLSGLRHRWPGHLVLILQHCMCRPRNRQRNAGGSGKAAEAYPPGRTERGGDCNDAQRGHCPADCRICENFRSNADCHWKSMMDQGFFRKRRGWTERLTDLVPDLEIHIIPDSNIITIYLVGVMMTSILTSGYTCSVISSVISVVLFNYFLTEPRLTLYAYGSGYPVTFAIMLGISILTGTLASKLKENAKLSARDAFRTKFFLIPASFCRRQRMRRRFLILQRQSL